MSPEYAAALRYAHEHHDVTITTTDDQFAEQCEWCQVIGTRNAISLYWDPRADVLSDGYAECCLSCAPERIRRAVDDSLLGAVVRVEIPEVMPV